MNKSKFTGEQIAFVLRQAEVGTPVAEVCRKMGVSEATYYRVIERPSCAVLRIDHKTHRYRSIRGDQAPRRDRIKDIAATCVRYGNSYAEFRFAVSTHCFGGRA